MGFRTLHDNIYLYFIYLYMIHAGYKPDQMYTREPGMSGGRLGLSNPDYSVICV